MIELLAQLRRLGYRVTVEGGAIQYRYIGGARPLEDSACQALAALRLNKQAALEELRREAEEGWPPESYESEARFGVPEAQLHPFLNRRVEMPGGPGLLLQVIASEAVVDLDTDAGRTHRFSFTCVRPPGAEGKGKKP